MHLSFFCIVLEMELFMTYNSIMVLTDTQELALSKLKEFIESPKDLGFFLLSGSAGTGKTTIVNEFINWYNGNKKISLDDIVVTAPTNKAVRVLKTMGGKTKTEYKTLHSLLGIRLVVDDNGKEVFENDPSVKSTIYNFGCIVVDEASMLDDFIFYELMNQCHQAKVIFVGDRAQIPPVNHVHSKPMIPDVQQEFGIEVFSLTEIVRQAQDNPIIKTSIEIRQGTFERNESNNTDENGCGVIQLNNKNKEYVYSLIKKAFCSEEFSKNSDYAKVIAWRNKVVDSFNTMIRSFIYHTGVNRIVEGEKLIMNRPILEGKNVVIYVNDDLIVESLTVETDRFFQKSLNYYLCKVRKLDPSDKKLYTIKILHEDSDKKYESILNSLRAIALGKKKNERGKAWKAFYDFKNIFADIAYGYAITAHKSQGSTYKKAFVCYSDIVANQNTIEMQRILYTAATRPSETLYIL